MQTVALLEGCWQNIKSEFWVKGTNVTAVWWTLDRTGYAMCLGYGTPSYSAAKYLDIDHSWNQNLCAQLAFEFEGYLRLLYRLYTSTTCDPVDMDLYFRQITNEDHFDYITSLFCYVFCLYFQPNIGLPVRIPVEMSLVLSLLTSRYSCSRTGKKLYVPRHNWRKKFDEVKSIRLLIIA